MNQQKVTIKNLVQERTVVYADEVEIDVVLSPDDQQKLYEFLVNLAPGSKVPIKVNLNFPTGVNLILSDYIKIRGELNKRSWWDKFLR